MGTDKINDIKDFAVIVFVNKKGKTSKAWQGRKKMVIRAGLFNYSVLPR